VHGIKGLRFGEGQLGPLHRLDGEAVLDDAVNDLASVASAGSIRLDHGEGAVCSHVPLNCVWMRVSRGKNRVFHTVIAHRLGIESQCHNFGRNKRRTAALYRAVQQPHDPI
jgi:hypothetical protein